MASTVSTASIVSLAAITAVILPPSTTTVRASRTPFTASMTVTFRMAKSGSEARGPHEASRKSRTNDEGRGRLVMVRKPKAFRVGAAL